MDTFFSQNTLEFPVLCHLCQGILVTAGEDGSLRAWQFKAGERDKFAREQNALVVGHLC